MANSRPVSVLSQPNSASDEANINGLKNNPQNKETSSARSSIQKSPTNNIRNANSSSSSIDSAGAKNTIFAENKTSTQTNSNTIVSWTTTDSDLESEQDGRSNNDNNSLESNSVKKQIQRSQTLSRHDNGQQKNETNSQEQLSRRVKHFQKLFRSEIHDDMPELIDSYVCAYQGDILLQGKMYITDRYLCFHSRIISYVTKHVYRWEQIENVTKERVAFIFPTAIGIQLRHSGKKIIYASFLQRDQAFDKIVSMCSRFNNDINSLQNDDDNRLMQDGTLKAINSNYSYNEKIKKSKRDIPFDMIEGPEQEDVLQMCLGSNATSNNSNVKRRPQSSTSKISDNKQQSKQSKKLFNSDKKKQFKSSSLNPTVPKNLNESIPDNNELNRNSSSNNTQEQEADAPLTDNPVVFRHSRNGPLRSNRSRSRSRERTLSPATRTSNMLSSIPSTSSITTPDSSIINSDTDGIAGKYSRIIILSLISIVKLIMAYLLLLFNRFKTYPIKTSLILLICIAILIFHSFYLINLAYRIENRLQSLHNIWPSSSSTKNSRHQ
ncbi:unnamed protein product [Rotaria magnacalcarata]|uniref:GRAM domain-containing protein n=1 Tax=Rotaria magnacalcarata TaxID=392030 RepID=A0A816WE20_9BILA|nr:unnamed protein product [Rotaria magnacalcarata]CAF1649664.1 unnamed protein product [Rotaria magnacalcarata]CAF2135173.1 unnamed protein product [Rotaria magnacalcarata]CAF2230298.1 unnamed protein product [Rotaria magnacalcarata]CAF3893705.1 unnamed protein product [Rotaria magnacalcarata]